MVPAVAVLVTMGERGVLGLLVLSQVILCLQLPFAMVPLIRFTNDGAAMGAFASPRWVRYLAFGVAVTITGLNVWLVWQVLTESGVGGIDAPLWRALLGLVGFACASLLIWIAVTPLRPARSVGSRGQST